MEEKRTITEFTNEMLKKMEQLKYSYTATRHFKYDCKYFSGFVQEKTGSDFFTEEIGAKYLVEKFDYPAIPYKDLPLVGRNAVRCIRRLGEYKLFGVFNREWSSHKDTSWYLDDKSVIIAYIDNTQTADNKESTKNLRTHHIKKFYNFLAYRGMTSAHSLSTRLISDYVLSLQGYAPTSNQMYLTVLRNYFSFLYKIGYCTQDFAPCVPRIKSPQNLTLPALWKPAEIENILKSIDRSNPVGKRDYALILLAVQLGLRSSDISNLKLESLKWGNKEIAIIQHKTGSRLIHPMLDDLGWAIIDYIKYARPKVDSPFVFLTANAPYCQIKAKSVSATLKRHIRQCGIKKPQNTTKGIHSLRHAFARRLLEQGTPLPEVADIMGHASPSSTTPYLKVDIDGLRSCSLSLPEVLCDV